MCDKSGAERGLLHAWAKLLLEVTGSGVTGRDVTPEPVTCLDDARRACGFALTESARICCICAFRMRLQLAARFLLYYT